MLDAIIYLELYVKKRTKLCTLKLNLHDISSADAQCQI